MWLLWLFIPLVTAANFTIPIYFPLPLSLRFILVQTQLLLDESSSSTKLLLTDKPASDGGYEVVLGFSNHESYYMDPFSRQITIFETDLLISTNLIPEFIRDVLLEIFEEDLRGYCTSDGIIMDKKVRIRWLLDRWVDYDELMNPVWEILRPLCEVELNIEVGEVDVDGIRWNYDELIQVVITDPSRSLQIDDVKSNEFIIPHKGSIYIHYPDYNEDASMEGKNGLSEMDTINIMEKLTSQLFRLLGAPSNGPLSPYYKLDYMIKRQLYLHYNRLSQADRLLIDPLLQEHRYIEALAKIRIISFSYSYPPTRSSLDSNHTS
jgi:hypothetical protein